MPKAGSRICGTQHVDGQLQPVHGRVNEAEASVGSLCGRKVDRGAGVRRRVLELEWSDARTAGS